MGRKREGGRLPFGLVLLKDLALGVVADHLGSEIAHDVQLLGTESCGSHFAGNVGWRMDGENAKKQ